MPIPITSADPCFDPPLPSAPTPGFDPELETSTSLFDYVTLPLAHPTTFTILFSALFFVLTVIPVTVCLSLSLARQRHHTTEPKSMRSNADEDGIVDTASVGENERLLSVWRIPFGSPIYYVDKVRADGHVQSVLVEKGG